MNIDTRIKNEKTQIICRDRATRSAIDIRLKHRIFGIAATRYKSRGTDSTAKLPDRKTVWLFQSGHPADRW